MAIFSSTSLYHDFTSICLTLLYFTMALVHCTWLYITLIDSTLIFYRSPSPLFDSYSIHMHGSTLLHLDFTWLYLTLLLSWFHFSVHDSTISLLHSTLLYIALPWLYFPLYFTLDYSTMTLLHSSLLYITLPWFYFTLLYPSSLYHGSTSLYLTLLLCTMALLHSTWRCF